MNIQQQEEMDHGHDGGIYVHGYGPFANMDDAIRAAGGDTAEDCEREEEFYNEWVYAWVPGNPATRVERHAKREADLNERIYGPGWTERDTIPF